MRWLVPPLLLITGGLAAFNAVVDPFGLTRLVAVDGFNRDKVLVADHRRLVKAHRIRQEHPRGLILGTSQADAGLDAGYAGWPAGARPVFNAGLPYANAYELLRYFQHALACGEVREAVVGLDLVSFNAFLGNQADFLEARLAVDPDGRWQRPPVDERLALLLSWDATWKSIETIRRQGRAKGQGSIDCRTRFLMMEAEYAHYMWRHGPQRTYSLGDGTPAHSYFDEYRKLLVTARERGVKLRLFFSPVHVRLLEVARALGWWPVLEEWKSTLAAITDEVNALDLAGPACELWDFADYTAVTTEPVPAAEQPGAAMAGYTDSAHYSEETGNLVLDRLFGATPPGRVVPPGFGVRLGTGNLAEHLAAVRSRAAIYRASHAADIAEVDAVAHMKNGDAMSRELDRLRAAAHPE